MNYERKLVDIARKNELTVTEEARVSMGRPEYILRVTGFKRVDGKTIELSQNGRSRKEVYKKMYSISLQFLKSNKVVYSPEQKESSKETTGPITTDVTGNY